MCGCGTDTWCDGGCECGCDHDTPRGMRRQGQHFALQYKDMRERASDAFARGGAHEREVIAAKLEELRLSVGFGRKPGFRQGFMQCWSLVKERISPRPSASSPE